MSWMGYFARTMAEVAEYLGEEEDLEDYRRHEKGIVANLDGESELISSRRDPLTKTTRRLALERRGKDVLRCKRERGGCV
jgi:hypothetical protein